jgi:hypothetical protein
MEVVSLTDLFLKLYKVLSSHIQNLRSLIIAESTEWETVPKSLVVWELREVEVDHSWLKILTLQSVTFQKLQTIADMDIDYGKTFFAK